MARSRTARSRTARARARVPLFSFGPSVSRRNGAVEHTHVSTPLVLHFNGPAKVIFEREWTLPWDATAGKTPVLHLIEGLRKGRSPAERRDAMRAFDRNATFLDPWLRRVPGQGPLRYSCDIPW